MFSLMWSEHCSYKHSRPLLRGFPTTGDRVLQGPGENAGVVDVGDGLAVALKIESHNHPSAVEPFEGAATGVGGIVRDILAMGARPIALLDSLRFGELTSPRSRHLFTRSVAGIGHYGNCIGVPDRRRRGVVRRPLRGVVPGQRHVRRRASTRPGAARRGLGPGQRPRADRQPHRPRRHRRGERAGLGRAGRGRGQAPVGAGERPVHRAQAHGLLPGAGRRRARSWRCRTSAPPASPARPARWRPRGALGLDIDLDLVPLRERLQRGRDPGVREPGAHAGGGRARAAGRGGGRVPPLGPRRHGHRRRDRGREPGGAVRRRGGRRPARPACSPTRRRCTGCRASRRPPPEPLDLATFPEPDDLAGAWLALLARPNIASKRWIYERYDHLVGRQHDPPARRRRRGGAPARDRSGRSRSPPTAPSATASSTRAAAGRASVLEAARNLACVGARPVAATDCLNFPNPEKGSTGWRLAEAIAGMSRRAAGPSACRSCPGTCPSTMRARRRAILPTPVVGMMGLLERADASVGHALRRARATSSCCVGDDGVLDGERVRAGRSEGGPARHRRRSGRWPPSSWC